MMAMHVGVRLADSGYATLPPPRILPHPLCFEQNVDSAAYILFSWALKTRLASVVGR